MSPLPLIAIYLNGETYSVPSETTITQLVDRLALTKKRIALELNQAIIPRSNYDKTRLRAGDKVEIVTAIGGG